MDKRPMEICIVSDLHLGTFGCQAKELLNYLKSVKPKTLILNGDIIDINYIPGFVPSENSYLVNAPDGTLIASQVSASNPPESVLDLLICEEATSIKNQSIDLNTSIYPNRLYQYKILM